MSERRRESRVPTEVEVRIVALSDEGTPFTQAAVARNISIGGGLLVGLGRKLRCGDLIRVQHCETSARFRVVWTGISQRNGPFTAAVHKLKDDPCPWAELLIESVLK